MGHRPAVARAQRRRRGLGSAFRKRSEPFRSAGPEAGASRLEARAPRRETVGVAVLRAEEAARSFRWWAPGGAPFEGADGCSRHMVVD